MKELFFGLLAFTFFTLLVWGAIYVFNLDPMPTLLGAYGAMTFSSCINMFRDEP